MRQYIEAFQCIGRTIGLQHFNILGYYRIAILQYIANYLFLQRNLTEYAIFFFFLIFLYIFSMNLLFLAWKCLQDEVVASEWRLVRILRNPEPPMDGYTK